MSLRPLHVYSGNMFGGIERFLVTVARHETAHGMRSRFVLCFEGLLARELRACRASVDVLGDVRVRHPWTVWRARRRLGAVMASSPLDVAVFHACWPLALFAPVARAHRLPVVYWSHDAPLGRHWIERSARRRAPDLVIANSHFTAKRIAHLFANAPREVVHYPSPPRPFVARNDTRARIRATLGVTAEQVVVFSASRIEPLKGHLVLVEALALLRDNPRWVCWFAGGATSRAERDHLDRISAAARDAGLGDRVRYLGHRGDVPDLLEGADVYCQPNTKAETFGLTFVEALEAALPVVTSAMGGALEIVDESCGVLVAPRDPAAVAAALHALIQDDAARARLGAAGPARARALCDARGQLERLRATLEPWSARRA